MPRFLCSPALKTCVVKFKFLYSFSFFERLTIKCSDNGNKVVRLAAPERYTDFVDPYDKNIDLVVACNLRQTLDLSLC